MKSIVLILGALVFLGVAGAIFVFLSQNQGTTGLPAQTGTPQATQGTVMQGGTNTVEIKGFAFAPAEIKVKKGQTIIFTNNDLVGHSVTADDGSFDTGVFAQNQSKSLTFDKVGTFPYHCTPHPNMKGKVIVE